MPIISARPSYDGRNKFQTQSDCILDRTPTPPPSIVRSRSGATNEQHPLYSTYLGTLYRKTPCSWNCWHSRRSRQRWTARTACWFYCNATDGSPRDTDPSPWADGKRRRSAFDNKLPTHRLTACRREWRDSRRSPPHRPRRLSVHTGWSCWRRDPPGAHQRGTGTWELEVASAHLHTKTINDNNFNACFTSNFL